MEAREALSQLWRDAGCDPAALELIEITGRDPVLPSSFRLGAAAAAIAASALAIAEYGRLRGGGPQRLSLDLRAAAASFRSERYLRVDGRPAAPLWNEISGFYRTADRRWLQLHTNFPSHRRAAVATLRCPERKEAVAGAVERWTADALEMALTKAGGCGAIVRNTAEWQAHPQAAAIATLPLLEVRRIGDSRPEILPEAERPLSGLRVLDLTRVIAGPVCGRTLTAQGATVMRVDGPWLGDALPFIIDTGLGKLSAMIDLRTAEGMRQILSLVRGADVFVQAYRPGALAALGLSPARLAALRPGLIQVQLSAYGRLGPWAQRRGFDSLVQSCSGIAWEEGAAFGGDGPRHLPAQVLDHATGHLTAFGALIALSRRARDGGSWLVEVSLAQTGRWLQSLGRIDATGCADPGIADIADLLQTSDSAFGNLAHVRPAARFSRTRSYWATPPVPIGTHLPTWP